VRDQILGFGVLASGDPEWELRDPRWTCGTVYLTLNLNICDNWLMKVLKVRRWRKIFSSVIEIFPLRPSEICRSQNTNCGDKILETDT